jgi:hypothetical protein
LAFQTPSDGKIVVIKEVKDSTNKIGTLLKDYVITKELDHPGICEVLGLYKNKDTFYFIMPL